MNVNEKQSTSISSSYRMNLIFIVVIMAVLITLIWAAYFAFVKYDRESTISMYGGRQHAVLALSGLALRAGNSVGGPFGMIMIEESMMNADENPVIKKEVLRHQKTPVNDRNMVGYGNMIITLDNRVVLVSGYMTRYFREEETYYKHKNKTLNKHINRFSKKLHKSKKNEYILSELVNVGGKEYLLTGTSFNFMPRQPVVFLYANTNVILTVYGYYKRRMWFARAGAVGTFMILLCGGLLIRSLQREKKGYLETRKLAEDLQKEINERVRSEQERNKLQEQLVQSQKMDAVGQLAGGLAHDFNNMLGVIMGNADLMLHTMSEDDQGYKRARDIMQAALRSRNLTMKLLTFSRREKLNVTLMDIQNVIDDLMPILERTIKGKIEIKTDIQKNLFVRVDTTQIEQALLNICTNARDAMPGGGVLSIECREAEPHDVHVLRDTDSDHAPAGKFCEIIIKDTGIGMSEQLREKVFEPFFTTKGAGAGTGLGMSITLGIIRSHNGFISIDSDPDRGTSVNLFLPLEDAQESPAMKKAEEPEMIRGTETILIVDDEPEVLSLAGDVLTKAGYKALTANSGEEALEIFRERASDIALVILDMVMPHMDGGDVYHALRDIDPDVRVLLASGYSKDGRAGELLNQGVRGFVQKPFRIKEFLKEVRQVLDE